MANLNAAEFLEALAADIGQEIYIDVARWHLYLRDAHLHVTLAERLLPLLEAKNVHETDVNRILQTMLVKIGGGRQEIPLADLLPMQGKVTLMDILEKYLQQI